MFGSDDLLIYDVFGFETAMVKATVVEEPVAVIDVLEGMIKA